MYKLCKTEQSAARQRMLEQGLLQAMLTQQYEDISVSELCDRLNIPRKSFYRYFSSKDGALAALVDHTLMEFAYTAPKGNKSKLTSAIIDLERFFLFWHDHKEFLDALSRSRMSGMLVERAISHAIQEHMMPRYMRNLSNRAQSRAMTFAVCGLLAMVIQWHHSGYQESPAEVAKVATMMLSRPLVPGELE